MIPLRILLSAITKTDRSRPAEPLQRRSVVVAAQPTKSTRTPSALRAPAAGDLENVRRIALQS